MNNDDIIREIRGTDAQRMLLALDAADQPLGPMAAGEAIGVDHRAAVAAGTVLADLKLVGGERSAARELTLNSQGLAVAARIRQSLASGPERWDAVQRAIVKAVLSEEDDDVAEVDGIPVTEPERLLVIAKLEEWKLVKVTRESGGMPIALFPRDLIYEVQGIEGLLRDHYERNGSVTDNRNTTNIHGSTVGAVQTGGHGNVASGNEAVGASERSQILLLAGQAASALDAEAPASLREAIEEIREAAAQPEVEKQGLRSKIGHALYTSGVSGATGAVTRYLLDMAALLG